MWRGPGAAAPAAIGAKGWAGAAGIGWVIVGAARRVPMKPVCPPGPPGGGWPAAPPMGAVWVLGAPGDDCMPPGSSVGEGDAVGVGVVAGADCLVPVGGVVVEGAGCGEAGPPGPRLGRA